MTTTLTLAIIFAMPWIGDDPRGDAARLLFERIETLQQSVNDFRCEFEGSIRFKGKNAETSPVAEDGLFETFGGTYIWQRGGDIRCESLHRLAVNGQIERHTLVKRGRDNLAYDRMSLGHPREVPNISTPSALLAARKGLGEIFVLHWLKAMAAENNYVLSVSDRQFKGVPCKVVSMSLKDIPDALMAEYFIDMERSGHVVRVQHYAERKELSGWFNIKLDSFNVDGAPVWMPVSGESVGLMAVENGAPILTNGPTSIRSFQIIRQTLEFNKHPDAGVFSSSYVAPPPVSPGLRKLEDEFARQVIRFSSDDDDAHETTAGLGTKQRGESAAVVVVPPVKSIGSASWLVYVCGALVAIVSLAVWMHRRGRSVSVRRRAGSDTTPC